MKSNKLIISLSIISFLSFLSFLTCSNSSSAEEDNRVIAPERIQILTDSILHQMVILRNMSFSNKITTFLDTNYWYWLYEAETFYNDMTPLLRQAGILKKPNHRYPQKFMNFKLMELTIGGYYNNLNEITLFVEKTDSIYLDTAIMYNTNNKTAIAHELTHLLQDAEGLFTQAYNSLPPEGYRTTEDWMRFRSVIEGDASFSMDYYYWNFLIQTDNPIDSSIQSRSAEEKQFYEYICENKYDNIYMYLYSPYIIGGRFFANTFEDGNWEKVYSYFNTLPLSFYEVVTEKDITPDEFSFDILKPYINNKELITEDTYGSYTLSQFLSNFDTSVNDTKINSLEKQYGWQGDRIIGYKNSNGEPYSFIWAIAFDGEESTENAVKIISVMNTSANNDSYRPFFDSTFSDTLADNIIITHFFSKKFNTTLLRKENELCIIENMQEATDTIINEIVENTTYRSYQKDNIDNQRVYNPLYKYFKQIIWPYNSKLF